MCSVDGLIFVVITWIICGKSNRDKISNYGAPWIKGSSATERLANVIAICRFIRVICVSIDRRTRIFVIVANSPCIWCAWCYFVIDILSLVVTCIDYKYVSRFLKTVVCPVIRSLLAIVGGPSSSYSESTQGRKCICFNTRELGRDDLVGCTATRPNIYWGANTSIRFIYATIIFLRLVGTSTIIILVPRTINLRFSTSGDLEPVRKSSVINAFAYHSFLFRFICYVVSTHMVIWGIRFLSPGAYFDLSGGSNGDKTLEEFHLI